MVRRGEKVARLRMLACQRAKDELRHRHIRSGVDAVSGDVPERDRKAAVVEPEEVVDVATDIEAGRRFVDVPELDALDLRIDPGEQRPLHRVRKALLLLVEAGILERERGLAGDRQREL